MSEQEQTSEAATVADDTVKKQPLWRRLLTKKRLAALAGCCVLIPVLGYVAVAATSSSDEATISPEVSLGAFWYETTTAAASEKIRAEFKLHLELLPQVDGAARQRLEARKFKVQQNVEELLRRAHNADFEDAALTELKRQIQVQINETIGMRGAIHEVIVTDLVVEVLDVKGDESAAAKEPSIYRNLEGKVAPATSEESAVGE